MKQEQLNSLNKNDDGEEQGLHELVTLSTTLSKQLS